MTAITRRDIVKGGAYLFCSVVGVAMTAITITDTRENAVNHEIFRKCCTNGSAKVCETTLSEYHIVDRTAFCKEHSPTNQDDFFKAFEAASISTGIIMICGGLLGFGHLCYTKNVGHIKAMVDSCRRRSLYQSIEEGNAQL